MSRFWNHYAQANDDIRNKLIDEAWFERQTGATPFQDDVARMEEREREPDPPPPPPEPDPEREALYGRDTEQPEGSDLYGEAQETPADERSFYGYDALDAPEQDGPDMER